MLKREAFAVSLRSKKKQEILARKREKIYTRQNLDVQH